MSPPLCDMLNLRNEGDRVSLSSFGKLSILSKTDSEVYNKVLTSYKPDQKIKTTQLKPKFRVYF